MGKLVVSGRRLGSIHEVSFGSIHEASFGNDHSSTSQALAGPLTTCKRQCGEAGLGSGVL